MSVQIMLAGFTVFEKKEDIKVKIKIIAGLTANENVRWKLEFTKQRLQNWKTVIEKSEHKVLATVKSSLGWLLILHMECELQSEEETTEDKELGKEERRRAR